MDSQLDRSGESQCWPWEESSSHNQDDGQTAGRQGDVSAAAFNASIDKSSSKNNSMTSHSH